MHHTNEKLATHLRTQTLDFQHKRRNTTFSLLHITLTKHFLVMSPSSQHDRKDTKFSLLNITIGNGHQRGKKLLHG